MKAGWNIIYRFSVTTFSQLRDLWKISSLPGARAARAARAASHFKNQTPTETTEIFRRIAGNASCANFLFLSHFSSSVIYY